MGLWSHCLSTSWPQRAEIGGHDPLPLEVGGLVNTNAWFVLIARASDKINEIHGARPQMHGRAADLVGGRGGGGGGGEGSSFPTNN